MYELNKLKFPKNVEENLAMLKKKVLQEKNLNYLQKKKVYMITEYMMF